MRINVVIATHKRCDLLERTLQSLADAKKPIEFECVIVVENASNDGSNELCERHAASLRLTYFNRQQSGRSRSIQWAVEQLREGFVLFLDDDIRVSDDLLERYAAAIRVYGRGHFYGGPLYIDYEAEPEEWLKAYLPRSALGWVPKDPNQPFAGSGQYRFLGANFGAFAEDILAIGGFNPEIGAGAQHGGSEGSPTGEERELQNRFLDAGYKPIYVGNAMVWHYVPTHRCTARWALHRISRNHLTRTLCEDMGYPFSSTFVNI